MILAACAHDKFANAASGIRLAIRCLRREAFVIMVVAVDDDICISFVERLPKRLDLWIIAVSSA